MPFVPFKQLPVSYHDLPKAMKQVSKAAKKTPPAPLSIQENPDPLTKVTS